MISIESSAGKKKITKQISENMVANQSCTLRALPFAKKCEINTLGSVPFFLEMHPQELQIKLSPLTSNQSFSNGTYQHMHQGENSLKPALMLAVLRKNS